MQNFCYKAEEHVYLRVIMQADFVFNRKMSVVAYFKFCNKYFPSYEELCL
jgi:hypothetical protein